MSLRDAMPATAEFIDALREVFGTAEINTAIKKGMSGLPGHFYAIENGKQAGTPSNDWGNRVCLADIDVSPVKNTTKGCRRDA